MALVVDTTCLNSNKYLLVGPRWGLTPRLTDWLTVSRNVTLTLTTVVQWLRLALSKGPDWVGVPPSPHLRTETDTISETSCFLFSRIPDDGKVLKRDWGTLVPRINVENGIKLGFFIGINIICTLKLKLFKTLLYVQYIIFWNYPKRLVCSYVSELIAYSIPSSTKERNWISRICYKWS
jgi:hypothetical protein